MFPSYQGDDKGKAANTTFEPVGGLSLRDYFAAKAMQTILIKIDSMDYDIAAKLSYRAADEMLKYRGMALTPKS